MHCYPTHRLDVRILDQFPLQRRKMSIHILVICYITFFCYVLAESTLFIQYPTIQNIMYIPLDLASFLLPIWLLAWCYFASRSFSWSSIKYRLIRESRGYKTYSLKIISFMSLLIIMSLMAYQLNNYTTSGCFTIQDKYELGNGHYFVVNDTKIKCDKLTYESIIEGYGYAITYKSNVYIPQVGYLKTLD